MAQGKSEAPVASPDVLHVQHQIRANASELQDYFADLYKWEKTISHDEAARKQTPPPRTAVPMPRSRNAIEVKSTPVSVATVAAPSVKAKVANADAHTYDKGYKKWEKFDVDAALRDTDGDHPVKQPTVHVDAPRSSTKSTSTTKKVVTTKSRMSASTATASLSSSKSREDIEREDGNEHYKCGDYVAAIKSYTRALGFNSRNVVVLSNRAMAYLKNKEYGKAEDDCSLALKIDTTHVKSNSRRGTARNALGKHRLALLDFERALELDPKSKQIASQVAATKELIKTAIKRAPKRTQFSIQVVGETQANPDAPVLSPSETPVDKENAPRAANKKITVVEDPAVSSPIEKPLEERAEPAARPTPPPPAPMVTTQAPRTMTGPPLPKLPTKPAASSYEFLRVWKTFAPKGDAARAKQLLALRADYLRLLSPRSLPSVFKNSIESELLCDLFATIRQAMDVTGNDRAFVVGVVGELPRVPRFSMVVMFLTEKEKVDIAWVIETLAKSEDQGADLVEKLQALKPQYGLK